MEKAEIIKTPAEHLSELPQIVRINKRLYIPPAVHNPDNLNTVRDRAIEDEVVLYQGKSHIWPDIRPSSPKIPVYRKQ